MNTRFVHHVCMMDVTEVRSFLGLQVYHVAGVFDASFRVPLALHVGEAKPDAARMVRLLTATARVFGSPKYLITDLGGEFRGRIFAKAVGRLGIRQRFASAFNIHATARLERFWRTLKDTASLCLHRPLTIQDLERRLEIALAHYVVFRPYQGLLGATLAEALLGVHPACANALSPPGGRPGEGAGDSPFCVEYLDPRSRRFPVLKNAPDDRRTRPTPLAPLGGAGAALLSPTRAGGSPHPSRAISLLAHPGRSALPPV